MSSRAIQRLREERGEATLEPEFGGIEEEEEEDERQQHQNKPSFLAMMMDDDDDSDSDDSDGNGDDEEQDNSEATECHDYDPIESAIKDATNDDKPETVC